MFFGERSLRNVKSVVNCQVVGVFIKWIVNSEIYEQVFLLFDLNYIDRLVFLKVKRVIVNRYIIYLRVYERMKKYCGFVVFIEYNGGNYMVFVEYFLFERNLKIVFVVVKRIVLDFEKFFFVNDKLKYLFRIVGENESYIVVGVDFILEKIFYFFGNINYMCVVRVLNFCGYCR